MKDSDKLNVLVLGNSGAGKSTLIKAVSGVEVMTGVGEGNTDKISVYESDTWPLVFIDTKGFEYTPIKQFQTIHQIKQFTKSQLKNSADAKAIKDTNGIDVVWYCVEGTSRRVFADNISMMNRALKGWNNVPVIAVITKSYSEADERENVQAVCSAFAKSKGINLIGIIPVVAIPYRIDDSTIVASRGIDELCERTLECSDMAKLIKKESMQQMVLAQKRASANAITLGATAGAIVVGAVPIPFADSMILVPLETGLVKSIFKCYGISFSTELVTAIIGSAAITNVARAVLAQLKTIPNIAASVLNAVVAGVFVGCLGEAVIALSEAIYQGRIDPKKIDDATVYVQDKLKNNPALAKAVSYLTGHSNELGGKSAKEILSWIVRDTVKR